MTSDSNPAPDDDNFLRELGDIREKENWSDSELNRCRFNAKVEAQQSPDLRPFHVDWDDISTEDVGCFERTLEAAEDERPLQHLFEQRPSLLAQRMSGGHGRWVIPQPRLAAEFVPDFLTAQASSIGIEWLAVELESPHATLFKKNGDPTAALTHAIRQITDWRTWLSKNAQMACNSKDNHGLGLPDIDANIPGLILLGRRAAENAAFNLRRRQMMHDLRIGIHSYDWLLEWTQGRMSTLRRAPKCVDTSSLTPSHQPPRHIL